MQLTGVSMSINIIMIYCRTHLTVGLTILLIIYLIEQKLHGRLYTANVSLFWPVAIYLIFFSF